MKVLMLAGMCLLAACGSYIPLEVLEEQAMLTGDWSAVERREQIIAERRARSGNHCPNGYITYCETRVGRQDCTCMRKEVLSSLVYGY